jgi:hypothetical protein
MPAFRASLLALLPICAVSALAQSGDNLVLFAFDDHWLPWRSNLQLTLERPVKAPENPVVKHGPPASPDGYGVLLYGTVLHENGKFRMWYIAEPRPDATVPGDAERLRTYRPIAYAESKDGVHWEKPALGLVEFRGNKQNNLVRIEPWLEALRPYDYVSILRDDRDPSPDRRYKMVYIANGTDCRCSVAMTATSRDGLSWKLVAEKPITDGSFESSGLVRFNGKYYISGQAIIRPPQGTFAPGTPAGRVLTVFESSDFLHWSKGSAIGFWRGGEYTPAPVSRGQESHLGAGLWNRGNVILGLYGRWYGDTVKGSKENALAGLKMDLGFVISNDAIHYREPVPRFSMIEHGPEGAWDSESLLQATAYHNTETETYIWYSHWNTSTPGPLPIQQDLRDRPHGLIGMARMPRDRFGYLARQPGKIRYNEVTVVSAPLRLARKVRLYANVDGASRADPLRVELVDDASRPLAGFSAELAANGFRRPVEWRAGAALPVNRSFRVKVSWPREGEGSPKLYALYVEP